MDYRNQAKKLTYINLYKPIFFNLFRSIYNANWTGRSSLRAAAPLLSPLTELPVGPPDKQ